MVLLATTRNALKRKQRCNSALAKCRKHEVIQKGKLKVALRDTLNNALSQLQLNKTDNLLKSHLRHIYK